MVAPANLEGFFSLLPLDIKEQILIESAKSGSFKSLVCVNKQIRGIAKDMLTLGPDHRPLSNRGQKLQKARAVHYLTSSFGRTMDVLPAWLKNEPKVLLAALKNQLNVWQQTDPILKVNPDYIFKALKINPRLMHNIFSNFSEILGLKHALSLPLEKSFKELDMASMTNEQLKVWACTFVHLNHGMKRESMLNPMPLLTQKLTPCEMRELYKVLVSISTDAIEFIQLDKKTVLEIVKIHGHTLEKFPSCFRLDREIAIEAIRGRSSIMKSVSATLKLQPNFMKDAIRANMSCIDHIPVELRNDHFFMRDACIINPHALKYLGDNLRGDPVFFASIAHLNNGIDPEVTHLFQKKQKKWASKSN
jgi:hypothetical protein